jgi:type VI protein secretion system component Hcp
MGASGTTDAYPIEEILLNFSQIKISYRPMKADGTYDPFIETGWDVKSMEKR